MAELSGAPPPFPLDAVWQAAHAKAEPSLTPPLAEASASRRHLIGPIVLTFTAAVAVAAAAIMILRPARPTDLVKGRPWTLTVIAKRHGSLEATRASSGVRLAAGDRLRFEVATTLTPGYVAILGLDSAGVVTPLVPADGDTVEIRDGGRMLFDGAVELDQTAGPERIELLGCPRSAPVATLAAAAREALKTAGGDLRKVGQIAPGCHQETFWIEKTKS
jgi:hypothetical protein